MTLYRYLCTECDTVNYISWIINASAPCCSECGQDDRRKYRFEGYLVGDFSIETKEEE
ncbi:unnamed protein product [Bacillus phage SPP1]|uniref:B.subtilis phage SPP1 DNA sequence coding for products required for replication initiation n=1 Tax=Bacillus phage SPP1 TaxID=10724 RepID=Q38140_BPSPP|nr:hypothetical protein SPP1p072 [Bacillus phage SPP1]CAA48051.1 unnamed protein product [Bacillus phage SPP1]CAA66539.1 unnamed protein product [Bacillus phage SPP1]prf//2018369C ORF 34.2 [Bacillus phage SPP1]